MKRKTVFISVIFLFCSAVLITAGIGATENDKTTDRPTGNDPNQVKSTAANPDTENIQDEIPSESPLPVLYKAFEVVLNQYVNDAGDVNYSMLRRKRSDLFNATKILENVHPAQIMAMTDAEKQAFWINAYNLCTLKLIIDNYPIEPKWYMILYPDNSIMQISNAWTKNYFKIQGLEYCLQEIEQELLLERFKDPRICFALSYATRGGAFLRKEPYRAETLDAQLDDQTQRYLATSRGLRWKKENNAISISTIFSSYREVFLTSKYAEIKKFRDRKDDERVWLNFLMAFLPEDQKKDLEKTPLAINFINYDWNLNEYGAPAQ